jgi:hypothetical protein
MNAITKRIKHVEELATKAFKNHTIESEFHAPQEGIHKWTFSHDKSSTYRFTIVIFPGYLTLVGDIESLVLCRTYDMIKWSRSAINSIEYFAEKVDRSIKTTEYDPKVAEEVIDEMTKQICDPDECPSIYSCGKQLFYAETVERFNDYFDFTDYDNKYKVTEAINDSGFWDGNDFPNLRNYTYGFLWAREAIKFALTLIPEESYDNE